MMTHSAAAAAAICDNISLMKYDKPASLSHSYVRGQKWWEVLIGTMQHLKRRGNSRSSLSSQGHNLADNGDSGSEHRGCEKARRNLGIGLDDSRCPDCMYGVDCRVGRVPRNYLSLLSLRGSFLSWSRLPAKPDSTCAFRLPKFSPF